MTPSQNFVPSKHTFGTSSKNRPNLAGMAPTATALAAAKADANTINRKVFILFTSQ